MKRVAKKPTQAQRNAERIRQKKEREAETKAHFANGGGFGPSPADKLGIRKEAAQYPRAAHTDVKDAASPRAPAEKAHAADHKVTVHNGIPDNHVDGADKVKGAVKAQPKPKKNYEEDERINKDIYLQSFKTYVQMRGDLEHM
jgi:hypothetical protein